MYFQNANTQKFYTLNVKPAGKLLFTIGTCDHPRDATNISKDMMDYVTKHKCPLLVKANRMQKANWLEWVEYVDAQLGIKPKGKSTLAKKKAAKAKASKAKAKASKEVENTPPWDV